MGLCASKPPGSKYDASTGGGKEGAVEDVKATVDDVAVTKMAEKGACESGACPVIPLKPLPAAPVAMAGFIRPLPEAITNAPSELIGNLLDPVNGPACGLPYQVHYLGPPRPGCEEKRLDTVRAIGRIGDINQDPEIANILQLCGQIFSAPASLCALFDEQRVFITEQDGGVIPRGEFPWRWTLCGWSLAFKNPQILVIPDTHEDARFANNIKITKPPHVRFYCGAPLVASNGHRLGTLCFADVKPRQFDAAQCMMMNNLSELVVRQLEKNMVIRAKAAETAALSTTYGQLQRALDAFEHCVALVEVSPEVGYQIVYSNLPLQKLCGKTREEAGKCQLGDLFETRDGGDLVDTALRSALANNKSHTMKSVVVRSGLISGTVTLSLRPAAAETMDEHVMPIGIPAFLPQGTANGVGGKTYYFATIEMSTSSRRSSMSHNSTSSSAFNAMHSGCSGLEVQHLLGKGSFGSVYYGKWHGSAVAVKVIDTRNATGKALVEAALGQKLRHPGVLTTHTWFIKTPSSNNSAASNIVGSFGVGDSSRSPLGNIQTGIPPPRATGIEDLSPSKPRAVSGGTDNSSSMSSGNGHWAVINFDTEAGSNTSSSSSSMSSRKGHWAVINFDTEAGSNTSSSSSSMSSRKGHWAVINFDTEAGSNTSSSSMSSRNGHWAVINFDTEAGRDEIDAVLQATHAADMVVPKSCDVRSGDLRSSTTNIAHMAMEDKWSQVVMVMEYADKGSLQEGLDRGWLCSDRSDVSLGPKMSAVLATAIEIGGAMKYLHECNVVHGDLSGWNIMLTSQAAGSSDKSERGFCAKVADFGLARSLNIDAEILTKSYGCLTHQPPETLTKGSVSKATDVYSFGVLLWQMYTCSRPWSGLSHAQIIMMVGQQGAKLKWPACAHPEFRALATACMEMAPSDRPGFEEVVQKLNAMNAQEIGMNCPLGGSWE
ncbi:hypothetical protein FOA52_003847 [Chlamydomonas sp. UWO 241]|nr:hypothetical protein FOA52_003847 [Chlamydomonas sp. UWO 241]